MILEVVTQTADETMIVKQCGGDRVELVSGITEGALTPTYGSLKGVYEDTGVQAFCMIRPHNHTFVYTEGDIKEMCEDILNQKEYAASIVLGCLTENNKIDEESLKKLLDACGDIPVTFHMAIQSTDNYEEGLRTVAKYKQVKRVLTNFKVSDVKNGEKEIKDKLALCKDLGLEVTFAGGVNVDSMPYLKAYGVEAVHVSSAARIEGMAKNKLDENIIKRMAEICHCNN